MKVISLFDLLTCNLYIQVYLMTPEEGGRKKPCTKDMQLVRQIIIETLSEEYFHINPLEVLFERLITVSLTQVCFSKTWDCAAFVELEGKEMAMPGEDVTMHLR